MLDNFVDTKYGISDEHTGFPVYSFERHGMPKATNDGITFLDLRRDLFVRHVQEGGLDDTDIGVFSNRLCHSFFGPYNDIHLLPMVQQLRNDEFSCTTSGTQYKDRRDHVTILILFVMGCGGRFSWKNMRQSKKMKM